jgi:hypothetical protein
MVLAGVLLGAWQAGRLGTVAVQSGLRLSNYGMLGQGAGNALAANLAPNSSPKGAGVSAPPSLKEKGVAGSKAADDPYSVVGPPTLTAAQIDTILAGYGSPAAGQGATFVTLGRQYGLDPAFALAFYVQESHAGTRGVARTTHGIGNIRTTPGYQDYQGYRSYDSYAAGIEDWYKLIRELYVNDWGLTTVAAIVPRYAPAGDGNDPATYIANVQTLVAGWRSANP